MLLTVYNSKRDIYGNCYYAVVLTELGETIKQGTISAPNVNSLDCHNMGIELVSYELPIRQFNARFKNMPYLGCTWEVIKTKLFEV